MSLPQLGHFFGRGALIPWKTSWTSPQALHWYSYVGMTFLLRGNEDVIEAVAALEASATPTYCTAISWAEIYAGLRAGEEAATVAFFEARGEVVELNKIKEKKN